MGFFNKKEDTNTSFTQTTAANWPDLELQALRAANEGNSSLAITLFKQSIEQGGDAYIDLLTEMKKVVSGPTSTVQDVQDMLDWANRARDAGQGVDPFISFARTVLNARNAGVGPEASLEEQYAASLRAAQAEAMAKAGPVDKEKLIEEIRKDPAKAAQVRQMLGEDGLNAILNGNTPAAAAPGSWTCSCGTANAGKFCENCGSPRP